MNWKNILRRVFLFVLKTIGKLFLLCLWACLRGIEFISRALGDWIKSIITPNNRRDDNRKTP
ncbi:MAG: hypothetical protein ABIQ40_18690 [Bacteroidia bacterium]